MPPAPANGHLSCIDFFGDEICQVMCHSGYEPIKPFANSYTYINGQWITDPEGAEFPWADCVAGKHTQTIFTLNRKFSFLGISPLYHYIQIIFFLLGHHFISCISSNFFSFNKKRKFFLSSWYFILKL